MEPIWRQRARTVPCGCGTRRPDIRLVLSRHDRAVSACAFAPDGSWIASAAADRSVKIWDVATGRERASYSGHTDVVNDCAIAPDGSYVVSVSLDGTMKLWDTSASLPAAHPPVVQHGAWVNGCAVSAAGRVAASSSSDQTVRLWDTRTAAGGRVLRGHMNSVRSCAFGADESYLVSASADKSLRVWDVRNGAVLATLLGHTDWVNGCSVSAGGQLVLSGSSDKTLRLWDTRTWMPRLRIAAHADSVNACRFAANGVFFVSASSDHTLKICLFERARDAWESLPISHQRLGVAEWERILAPRVLDAHASTVNDCAVSPDSAFIVSASADRTLRIWDVTTGRVRRILEGHRSHVYGCAISPDGRHVASVSADNTLKIWEVDNGECVSTLHVDGVLEDCAWMPDGHGIMAVGAAGVYFMTFSTAAAEPVVTTAINPRTVRPA
jgi:WD40 repeat protein